ncbi:MAG: hypothetical protein P8X98_01445 [Woeseiaceae bacterium]
MRRLFACLLCLVTATALADGTEPFQWSITPYLWASQTQLDLSLPDQALGGDTISFSDLLDQIDTAFMVNVETGRGRWSVFRLNFL